MNEIISISSSIELINEHGIKINGLSNINKSYEIHYLIYKITNLINGMYYYGQHKTKNPYDDYMGSGLLLENAKNKYGLDNFVKTILFDFDNKEEMNQKEIELVSENICYHSNPLCYNLVTGGKGGDLGPEVNKKISESIKGEKNGMYGKKLSPESRKKISDKLKGHPNYNPGGWHQSEDTKKILSEKQIGKRHTQETKDRIRLARLNQENVNTTGSLGMHWYHDPVNNNEDMFFENNVPAGWLKGRIKQKTENKKYYTNGCIDTLLSTEDTIPEGFVPGRHTRIKYTRERNKKISSSLSGKPKTTEHKIKLSNAIKGRHWYNNGIEEVQLRECPSGWVKGRILKRLKR